MKLIFKITLFYLLIALVVFIAGGVITFDVIKNEIDMEQQRFLSERLDWSLGWIERRKPTEVFQRDKIRIVPLGKEGQETEVIFSDTLVMHSTLQRVEPHFKLDVVKKVGDSFYKITLFDLIVEEDDIQEGVSESLIKLYLLLFIALIILSGVTSWWVLKPFHNTLDKIRQFRLDSEETTSFEKTSTREFTRLNHILQEMTSKMRMDYQALKEFTQNASHEMQTPLGIVSGKLELLLESNQLTNEQTDLVMGAQGSIRRLSKMNKALLLLTRIENKEFSNIRETNISRILTDALEETGELTAIKSLTVTTDIRSRVMLTMDEALFNILVSNLLQNAIRHNEEGGTIEIWLDEEALTIHNSGAPLPPGYKAVMMFERFKKDPKNQYSSGLGLAIVKKICDLNGFEVLYSNDEKMHKIRILFHRG